MNSKDTISYWICVVDNNNWQIVKKSKIWGVSDTNKKALFRTKIGDHLIFYILREKVIGGIFKIASDPFRDSKPIFKGRSFPNRITITPVIVPTKPVGFSKDLMNKLDFIKNKKS